MGKQVAALPRAYATDNVRRKRRSSLQHWQRPDAQHMLTETCAAL